MPKLSAFAKLWENLSEAFAEKHQTPHFEVYHIAHPEAWFLATVSAGKPLAIVDTQLSKLVQTAVEQADKANKLVEDQKASWQRAVAKVRAAQGTVTLSTAATATVLAATPDRTTATVGIYKMLRIKLDSLKPILDEKELDKVRKKAGSKVSAAEDVDPTPAELAEALGWVSATDTGGGAAEHDSTDSTSADLDEEDDSDDGLGQFNLILFGPPGTGKSYALRERVKRRLQVTPDKEPAKVFRVTFHPEYTYFDFVGTYRPTVGWIKVATQFRRDGEGSTPTEEEPRVFYEFSPGPFSLALAEAAKDPKEPVVLIIEEINRGNCAAIFGDVFQLLDRITDYTNKNEFGKNEFGWSEYAIRPSGEWAAWLDKNCDSVASNGEKPAVWCNHQLRLPMNLYLYATMNTSDQSLFPMDTAFRRRWSMQYVPVDTDATVRTQVPLKPGKLVAWRELMRPLNAKIVKHTQSDDKQMGPWFIKAATKEEEVTQEEFQSKVLFHLWSDVFRDAPDGVFAKDICTYDQLVKAYADKKDIFCKEIYDEVQKTKQPEGADHPDGIVDPTDQATAA